MTKTIRSPFNHEVGGTVEGCTILEKRVVIPPNPEERRRGVYDYLVAVPPVADARPAKAANSRTPKTTKPAAATGGTYTRASPEEMGSVIRRIGSR